MKNIDTAIVHAAMNKLFELAGLEGTGIKVDYPENMFAQRVVGPMAKGSIYEGHTVETLKEAFLSANWEAAENPAVFPGCQGYRTYDINGGLYGIVELKNLPDDAELVIKDNKSTGFASLCVEGGTRIPAEETWAIVGTADNGEKVVYTFYPGAPTPKATTPTEELSVGTRLTKAEALAKGFNTANVIGLLCWMEEWEETNPFFDPEKGNNGGGYSQPSIKIGFNDGVILHIEDTSCGDFGSRVCAVFEKGDETWAANYGSMQDQEESEIPEELFSEHIKIITDWLEYHIPTKEQCAQWDAQKWGEEDEGDWDDSDWE